jgi:spore coat polysaccharide biosynthesis predicted glycosyltransferase SpsG
MTHEANLRKVNCIIIALGNSEIKKIRKKLIETVYAEVNGRCNNAELRGIHKPHIKYRHNNTPHEY